MSAVSVERRRLSAARKATYALVVLAAVAGTCEIAARVVEQFVPPLQVDYGAGFRPSSRLFVPAPDRPGDRIVNPTKTGFVQNQRFAAHKPPGVLRIVAIGGSSVHDLDAELRILEQRLSADTGKRAEVINMGGFSYGTHREVPLLAEALEYAPDLVLLYTGHNEFEEVEQLDLANLRLASVEETLGRFATFRVLRDTATRIRVRQLRQEHNDRMLGAGLDVARAWKHRFTQDDVRTRMEAYRRNLETMVAMCRSRAVPLIIGTVPSNLWRAYLPAEARERFTPVLALYGQGRYAEGLVLARQVLRETPGRHQSSDLENGIIRAVAAELSVPLADVEKAVIAREPHGVPGETLFRDHCHLNERGNVLWRETYEPMVTQLLRRNP
jgi:lysophospholipase L1-like esterase